MHELQKLRVRTACAQLFDQPECNAAAAVHGKPGRLVDRDERVVFVKNGKRSRLCKMFAGIGLRTGSDGWNAQQISHDKPDIRARAFAIDTYLAASQDAVDMAFRY